MFDYTFIKMMGLFSLVLTVNQKKVLLPLYIHKGSKFLCLLDLGSKFLFNMNDTSKNIIIEQKNYIIERNT